MTKESSDVSKKLVYAILLFCLTAFIADTKLAAKEASFKADSVKEFHFKDMAEHTKDMYKGLEIIGRDLGKNDEYHKATQRALEKLDKDIDEIKQMLKRLDK
jgi:phosphopantetheinyl transferase (holo-ACP synthase)